jgi:hypothetical protein
MSLNKFTDTTIKPYLDIGCNAINCNSLTVNGQPVQSSSNFIFSGADTPISAINVPLLVQTGLITNLTPGIGSLFYTPSQGDVIEISATLQLLSNGNLNTFNFNVLWKGEIIGNVNLSSDAFIGSIQDQTVLLKFNIIVSSVVGTTIDFVSTGSVTANLVSTVLFSNQIISTLTSIPSIASLNLSVLANNNSAIINVLNGSFMYLNKA